MHQKKKRPEYTGNLRIVSIIALTCTALTGSVCAQSPSNSVLIQLTVDGNAKGTIRVFRKKGRTLIPFRPVMESLGWTVEYEREMRLEGKIPAKKLIRAYAPFPDPNSDPKRGVKDHPGVYLEIGKVGASAFHRLNPSPMAERLTMQSPSFIVHNRAYVPLTFLQEVLRERFKPVNKLVDSNAVQIIMDWKKRELRLMYLYPSQSAVPADGTTDNPAEEKKEAQ